MYITEQEQKYFEELVQLRKRLASAFEDPAAKGITDRYHEDNYSDQAHFIYELLQNADDTKHFTISNPHTHEEDKASGHLGDINAITAYASSNKKEATNRYNLKH